MANMEGKYGYSRVLAVLVVILIVVVAVESYGLARLERQRHGKHHKQAAMVSSNPSRATDLTPQPSAQPSTTQPDFSTNEDWFTSPFDAKTWSPFAEMRQMQARIDRMFHNAFGRFQSSPIFSGLNVELNFSPTMDLREEKDNYVVRFDLPGMDKSKIDVRLNDRTLTVSGAREEKIEKKEGSRVLQQERIKGLFERSVLLPGPVTNEGMQAKYDNGVLTVTIPKSTESHASKRIEVM